MPQATGSDTTGRSFFVQTISVASSDFLRRLHHLKGVAHALGVVPGRFVLLHSHSLNSVGADAKAQPGLTTARVNSEYRRPDVGKFRRGLDVSGHLHSLPQVH